MLVPGTTLKLYSKLYTLCKMLYKNINPVSNSEVCLSACKSGSVSYYSYTRFMIILIGICLSAVAKTTMVSKASTTPFISEQPRVKFRP